MRKRNYIKLVLCVLSACLIVPYFIMNNSISMAQVTTSRVQTPFTTPTAVNSMNEKPKYKPSGSSYSSTPYRTPAKAIDDAPSIEQSDAKVNKNDVKIDKDVEVDFAPYMRDMQRTIKDNWNPPKGEETRSVVLVFSIAKDGRLISNSVHKSSGSVEADEAALEAVRKSAPFKPLPYRYKGFSIDIQFTFDYNVFGTSIK